ncbi:cytochrome P450 [Halovulum dunhuangense]|uniref:Cytochrome P450 n=1 Tax=Halovulum dunhuangense TaxID=1505036 RepID=A0A849L693_9RHOB|nr:cytochrome P450 [Halovulum dunhuangense]NNU81939.1 cytochrome P450 [Halovulum dunhuangense]
MSSRDFVPPIPDTRPEGASVLTRLRLARRDLFASQPRRLYRGWMAQQSAVIFESFILNQPNLVKTVLEERPDDFPKSDIIRDSLKLLLGNSVFVTNGEVWKRQRRIIDPAFEGGRLREVFPAMVEAGQATVARLRPQADGKPVEIEFETAHAAADVIFRTLFSIPIDDEKAREVFDGFREYQRAQPLMTFPALLRLPRWVPRLRSRKSAQSAQAIRAVLAEIIAIRAREIAAGTAPDDLATKIMCTADPLTGERFDEAEMLDQVAIFFLAGHETSASALAWTLYMLACCPEIQERAAAEALAAWDEAPDFADMRRLPFVRDVFREALRLYPPVPMMVREATREEVFRKRRVRPGSLCILSPWHLQRHERIWDRPHVFDPDRWQRQETRATAREAYMPFSSGPRVCTGAGFAMIEGVILLALLLRAFRFAPVEGRVPVPVHHLTVRAKDGIWLRVTPRG